MFTCMLAHFICKAELQTQTIPKLLTYLCLTDICKYKVVPTHHSPGKGTWALVPQYRLTKTLFINLIHIKSFPKYEAIHKQAHNLHLAAILCGFGWSQGTLPVKASPNATVKGF